MKKLLRKRKNDKLKHLIENEEIYPTLNDSTGTTLLHLAAKYGNVEMMQYSIDLGSNIDAKDLFGTTPLMLATKYNQYQAIKFLLDANVDMFTINLHGEYSLQLAFNRDNKIYRSTIEIYCDKVKSNSSSIDEAVETLLTAGCSLDHAAIMQDTNLTQIFLEKIETFDNGISCRSVLASIFMIDPTNLNLLLTRGTQVAQRIEDFLFYLHDMTNTGIVQTKQKRFYGRSKTLETVQIFATKIIEWQLLTQHNLKFIKYIFEDANEDILHEFLQSGIVSHVQNNFNYNLLAHVYGNSNPRVIELLNFTNFESTVRTTNTRQHGVTALHIAVYRCIPNNVKFLLTMGVDPNVVDEHGETPLFCVLNTNEPLSLKIECIDLLLRNNADIEIRDNTGTSYIEHVALDSDEHLNLVEPVLAHLALLEAKNSPDVRQTTLEYINTYYELKSRYEACKRQLEEMKMRKVASTFSLMTVLDSRPERIARFVGVQIGTIIATLLRSKYSRELNEYYSKTFKQQLDRALEIDRLRCRVDHLIMENIERLRGYNLVIDKIISYFDFEELVAFTQ